MLKGGRRIKCIPFKQLTSLHISTAVAGIPSAYVWP